MVSKVSEGRTLRNGTKVQLSDTVRNQRVQNLPELQLRYCSSPAKSGGDLRQG